MLAITRRVYAADADHGKITEPLLVPIDLRDLSFKPVSLPRRPLN